MFFFYNATYLTFARSSLVVPFTTHRTTSLLVPVFIYSWISLNQRSKMNLCCGNNVCLLTEKGQQTPNDWRTHLEARLPGSSSRLLHSLSHCVAYGTAARSTNYKRLLRVVVVKFGGKRGAGAHISNLSRLAINTLN